MTVEYGVGSLFTLIILLALGIAIQRNAFNVNRIQTIGFWMTIISGGLLVLVAVWILFPLLSF
jgi:ABC-type nickel/cobalt efflux system permease component RcnA